MFKPVSIVLLAPLLIWPCLASARGGGGHSGGGHFGGEAGLHGGHERGLGRGLRLPGGGRLNRPAMDASTFAAIEMPAATDPKLATELAESLPAFNGRIIANDTSPSAVDGVSPASFILVAFATPDDMNHWKMSEPFKAFEAEAQKASARIFTVNAVPSAPVAERVDPLRAREGQAYQKLIEGNDRTLKKIQDICSHC